MSASEVADRLGVHIATAVTHLTQLADAGIAERRVRHARRRSYEYRLKSHKVTISVDLTPLSVEGGGERGRPFDDFVRRLASVLGTEYDGLLGSLTAASRQTLEDAVRGATVEDDSYVATLRILVAGSRERLGARATRRLLSSAGFDDDCIERVIGGE
jgi:predicted ArsR family transcriptional regulator